MIDENIFNGIYEKAKSYKFTSVNFIGYDDCKDAEIINNDDNFILINQQEVFIFE